MEIKMENLYVKACEMSDLIGKTVKALAISNDQSVLVVTHNEGRSVYKTWGDCCSETWIADIVGVCNLIGHTVVKAEDMEVPCVNDGRTRQEEDCFYGIKLTTTGGYVDIIYRNSSNGYYGGSLARETEPLYSGDPLLVDIHDDYSA
jgi:hypothetical protein